MSELIDDAWRARLQFNGFIAPHVEGWWVQELATTHDRRMTDQGTELGFVRLLARKP